LQALCEIHAGLFLCALRHNFYSSPQILFVIARFLNKF